MTDLILNEREQAALRALAAADPVPGSPLPTVEVLTLLAELIRCDYVGVELSDSLGYFLECVELGAQAEPPPGGGGPHYVGVVHWSREPLKAEGCNVEVGAGDGLSIGFRNGAEDVAQLDWERTRGRFGERDLAMLQLIAPTVQRLLRERPTPQLPASLTTQERRVLMHVATGQSNAQIADGLCIAESTVRKHLEHSYRKLGVSSRLAAIAALQGRDLPDLDLRERIARIA